MPCLRQWASTASTSSSSIVQPVGLLGELTIRSRVWGVSAASSRSRSSDHLPFAIRNGTRATSAPRIRGISVTLGQSGVTATTRSPGDSTSWLASISAETPEPTAAIRSGPIGRSCKPLR